MTGRESTPDAGSPQTPQRGPGDRGFVVLGKVVGAHALRGEVRVHYYGDGPGNLASAPRVWLAAAPDDPAPRPFEVVRSGSGRPGEVRLAFDGVSDRDGADALRGQLVLGDPGHLEALADDEFYWHELVGCEVFDLAGNRVGTVRELWETRAHDLLVVETDRGERHLLPTARELMREVDPEARRIVFEILPGMLDAPIVLRR